MSEEIQHPVFHNILDQRYTRSLRADHVHLLRDFDRMIKNLLSRDRPARIAYESKKKAVQCP